MHSGNMWWITIKFAFFGTSTKQTKGLYIPVTPLCVNENNKASKWGLSPLLYYAELLHEI